MNGLLWGAILGGSLTYLLSHKKGRELLKDLSENGIHALEGILEPGRLEEIKKGFSNFGLDHDEPVSSKVYYTNGTPTGHSTPAPKKRVFKGIKRK